MSSNKIPCKSKPIPSLNGSYNLKDSKSMLNETFIITIDLGKDRQGTIIAAQNDDPKRLAMAFCNKYRIGKSKYIEVVQLVKKRIVEYANSKRASTSHTRSITPNQLTSKDNLRSYSSLGKLDEKSEFNKRTIISCRMINYLKSSNNKQSSLIYDKKMYKNHMKQFTKLQKEKSLNHIQRFANSNKKTRPRSVYTNKAENSLLINKNMNINKECTFKPRINSSIGYTKESISPINDHKYRTEKSIDLELNQISITPTMKYLNVDELKNESYGIDIASTRSDAIPKIGRSPKIPRNIEKLPIGEYLYLKGKISREIIDRKAEERYNSPNRNPTINKRSELLFEQLREKSYKRLYNMIVHKSFQSMSNIFS